MTIVWRPRPPRSCHARIVVRVACLGLFVVAGCGTNAPQTPTTTGSMTTTTSTPAAEPVTVTAPPSSTTSSPSAAAQIGPGDFQSPSGGIFCSLSVRGEGNGSVVCQGGGNYSAPTPPNCHLAWGDRFSLDQGSAPVSHCHGDTIVPSSSTPGPIPNVPILGYGQTRVVGTITCDSEPSGVTCADSGTGHFFRMSREANELV
jgi:hypothetical protein